MKLNETQKNKLDNIQIDELKEETLLKLIRVSKIVQGEEALSEFEYEYDYDLDEVEQTNIAFEDFKKTAPTIYNKIIKWDGNKIFKAMEENKFVKLIVNKRLYEDKIKEIRNNDRINEEKKDTQIAIRKKMREEYEALTKLNGSLDSNTCWKIWKIKEGQKVYDEILENDGEEKLEKEIAQVKYLGNDFIKQCKDIVFAEEE